MPQFSPGGFLFQLASKKLLLYTILCTLALLHKPAQRVSLFLCPLRHFRSILVARVPLLSMHCVLAWVLLQAVQRGSRLLCFCFHGMYSKTQLKAYMIVWNSVGKAIKIGAICKIQVQAWIHISNMR